MLRAQRLEAETFVEPLRRRIGWFDVKLASDEACAAVPGVIKKAAVHEFSDPLTLRGPRDNDPINVQKLGEARRKPPVIGAVVGCALAKREEKGNDSAFEFKHLVICRLVVESCQARQIQRTEKVHRFLVQGKDLGEVQGVSIAELHGY